MGAVRLPAGIDEVDITGATRKEPLEVVKSETVDLKVPATAETISVKAALACSALKEMQEKGLSH